VADGGDLRSLRPDRNLSTTLRHLPNVSVESVLAEGELWVYRMVEVIGQVTVGRVSRENRTPRRPGLRRRTSQVSEPPRGEGAKVRCILAFDERAGVVAVVIPAGVVITGITRIPAPRSMGTAPVRGSAGMSGRTWPSSSW
jgi:hypothetical protein